MPLPRPVLILGSNGMLAAAVMRSLRRRGVDFVGVDRDECDATDPAQVAATFAKVQPKLLINCAAYTAVDKAEEEVELAQKINAEVPANLAAACRDNGTKLVHVSTDFVFDGDATTPYKEDDAATPVSAYGRTKLAGEQAIRDSGHDDWIIARTAWLYGPWAGRPFPKVMIDVARAGEPLSVVADQHGAPTMTVDLAEALLDLAAGDARGVYHVTNSGRTTWHGFAAETLKVFGIEPEELTQTTAAAYAQKRPDAARRPAFSVLDLSKTEAALGRPMRPWQQALLDYRNLSAGQ
jgi:dTDP-4-dehydrorhamnose reductase